MVDTMLDSAFLRFKKMCAEMDALPPSALHGQFSYIATRQAFDHLRTWVLEKLSSPYITPLAFIQALHMTQRITPILIFPTADYERLFAPSQNDDPFWYQVIDAISSNHAASTWAQWGKILKLWKLEVPCTLKGKWPPNPNMMAFLVGSGIWDAGLHLHPYHPYTLGQFKLETTKEIPVLHCIVLSLDVKALRNFCEAVPKCQDFRIDYGKGHVFGLGELLSHTGMNKYAQAT